MLGKSRAAMILAAMGAGIASMAGGVQMQGQAATAMTVDEAGTITKQPARGNTQVSQKGMDAIFRSVFGAYGVGRKRRPGLGYTNMQVKRMARKKINRTRNRKAHK